MRSGFKSNLDKAINHKPFTLITRTKWMFCERSEQSEYSPKTRLCLNICYCGQNIIFIVVWES